MSCYSNTPEYCCEDVEDERTSFADVNKIILGCNTFDPGDINKQARLVNESRIFYMPCVRFFAPLHARREAHGCEMKCGIMRHVLEWNGVGSLGALGRSAVLRLLRRCSADLQ